MTGLRCTLPTTRAARRSFGSQLAAAEQQGEARSAFVFSLQLCEVELRTGDAAAAARALEEWDQWAALEPEAAGIRARLLAVLAAVRGDPGIWPRRWPRPAGPGRRMR